MALVFQQPNASTLLDAINAAAHGADSGGGVFAFASKDGIEALMGCAHLTAMALGNKPFRLIVGMDAITNAEALLCLAEKVGQYGGTLTANAFLHQKAASIFHPKFLWFRSGETLRLLIGSGNLTQRGLGGVPALSNWEVFGIQTFEGAAAEKIMGEINAWYDAQQEAGYVRALEDTDVVNKAMANGQVRFSQRKGAKPVTGTPSAIPVIPVLTESAAETSLIDFSAPDILIREIPKNRPGQADVGQTALTGFFGYEGTPKDIFIQHVSDADKLGAPLKIRLFVNQSRNYRLELSAITDFPYEIGEDDSRMVLLASRLDSRSYRYLILPITHSAYSQVSTLLGPIPTNKGTGRAMREKRVSPKALLEAWPKVPESLLPINLDLSEF